jgi:ankyrin repeat protein
MRLKSQKGRGCFGRTCKRNSVRNLIKLLKDPDSTTAEIKASIENNYMKINNFVDGEPPLFAAIKSKSNRNLDLVLKESAANVDIKDSHSNTPCHIAVKCNNAFAIDLLIMTEARFDEKDSYGRTPLSHAVSKGYYDCVKILVEGNVNYIDHNNNNSEIITADIGSTDNNDKSVVDYICNEYDGEDKDELSLKILKLLCEWGSSDAKCDSTEYIVENVGELNVPKNAENAVMLSEIKNGNSMINFHDESKQGRYYTEKTFKGLRGKNPFTREKISRVKKYTAKIKKST